MSKLAEISQTLSRCTVTIQAMRVLRWCDEWPSRHSERPSSPQFVRDWERKHGPAPESALRTLNIPTSL